jgi:predicted DNA-binding protein
VTACMTPGKLPRVPNQPKTKAYAVRIDDERHQKLIEQAKVEGINFSEVVRNAIDSYIANPPPAPTPEEDYEAVLGLVQKARQDGDTDESVSTTS